MARTNHVTWSAAAGAGALPHATYAVFLTAAIGDGTLHALFQARDNGRLGLFGGALMAGEEPAAGLARELQEEIGDAGTAATARRLWSECGVCEQVGAGWAHRERKTMTVFLVDAPSTLVAAAAAVRAEGTGALWLPVWTRVTEPYWAARAPGAAARHNFEFPAWEAATRAAARLIATAV